MVQGQCMDAAAVVQHGSAQERRLAAVVFLDVVGYSTLMAEDERGTHSRWMRMLSEVIRPTAQEHRGRIVKSTGDGVLAEFPSAREAVDWAQVLQGELARNVGESGPVARALPTRVSVHLCDVYVTEDDIYGDGVNVAARLQEHAPPGGIVISEAVHERVRGDLKRSVEDLGLLELRNLPAPVRAFVLETGAETYPVKYPAHAGLPSVAVLPLASAGGVSDDDYFAEGIVEDIVVSLASLRELRVIARASALTIGRRELGPLEAGRALGVRYVLAGRLRRSPQQVRVSVQLYDVLSGTSLWGDRAEVAPDEVFELQDRLVHRVVAGIAPHVRGAELAKALRKRPESFSAYDHTLQGLDRMNSLERSTFLGAIDHLQRAMSKDPSFAMPIAWAARWHSLRIGQGWSVDPDEDSARGAELAASAIELDGQNAVALATYGHLQSYLFHDYDSALVYFDRALSASPNSALAWILSSGTQSYIGRGEQAVRHAERALALSPFDTSLFYFYTFLALGHYTAGAYEEAVKWGRVSLKEKPKYTASLRILAAAHAALGQVEEAHETGVRLLALEPDFRLGIYERTLQPFRDPEMRARYIGHLEQAALPQ